MAFVTCETLELGPSNLIWRTKVTLVGGEARPITVEKVGREARSPGFSAVMVWAQAPQRSQRSQRSQIQIIAEIIYPSSG